MVLAMYGRWLSLLHGIIHLVRTQNVPKNEHFLSPDTHTYMCV